MSEPLEHPQTPVAEGEDIGPYQLTNPLEIGAVLRQLVLRGDNVTIYFAHGRQLMLSRLLAVDVPKRELVLDVGGHEETNKALLNSDRNIIVGTPDGVKIQFVLSKIRPTRFDGSPAFAAAFPTDLIKLQRREFFRIETPLTRPYICEVTLPEGKRVGLELHDLSLGGIGAWALPQVALPLVPGMVLERAQLELGPNGMLQVDLEMRSKRVTVRGSGQEIYLVGFKFVNTSRAGEATLQRLMAQLERERKALTG
ncbi:flagellar brake protein [Silvimonas sp. JCM 19000]